MEEGDEEVGFEGGGGWRRRRDQRGREVRRREERVELRSFFRSLFPLHQL